MTTKHNSFASRVASQGQQASSSSCASNARLALPSNSQPAAPVPAGPVSAGHAQQIAASTPTPRNEFIEDALHPDELSSTAPSCQPASAATDAATAGGGGDGGDDASQRTIAHHLTRAKRIVDVKHVDPSALFRLRAFGGPAGEALHYFLLRDGKSDWMQKQRLYVQLASLAAAYDAMHPVIDNVKDYGSIRLYDEDEFDPLGFLKCGMRVRPRPGFPPVWVCNQPERCPRCNLDQRVNPAKAEFLPAFESERERGKSWFDVTAIGRSNPEQAGVKIEVGRDAKNQPIHKYLFRPADYVTLPRLSKFGLDDPDLRPQIVGEALHAFMRWLTDGKYFDGLHAFRDIDLTLFPDARTGMGTGIGHTVNCHQHAYGNTSRTFTGKIAQRMWFGCANLLRKQSGGELCAYPDILLRPLPTPAALKRAINYAIKCFKVANWYLDALKHGCPVGALNLEFFQMAFDCEFALSGTTQGTAFGNMSQKSGRYYIGDPPPVELTKQQVKRYLERSAADELFGWESIRYANHLEIVARRKHRNKKCENKN